MISGITGEKLKQPSPTVGHSISTASTPSPDQKGSTSSVGALSPTPRQQFIAQEQARYSALKKATLVDQLSQRYMARLDEINDWLMKDGASNLIKKLEKSSLAQIAMMDGVATDKILALLGKNTQHIEVTHQTKMDQVIPALLQAIQQRGLQVPTIDVTPAE